MNHVFSEIPRITCPRSMFRRNHNIKTTIGTDFLYPVYCDEALPADTFRFRQHIFARLNTPIVPLMDNLYLDTFYFAVPIRLIWDDWQKFMGERPFGDTTTVYEVPQLTAPSTGVQVGTLSDYLGIPINVPNLKFSALWHRAYNLIYNEWFRDENLCNPIPVGNRTETSNTHVESYSDYNLMRRGKRHDYFTSCLPWPQKGEAVGINLGNSAPVWGDGTSLNLRYKNSDGNVASGWLRFDQVTGGSNNFHIAERGSSAPVASPPVGAEFSGTNYPTAKGASATGIGLQVAGNDGRSSGLYADLSSVSAITINSLREAVAIQSLLEIDARGGTRYIELLLAHFGVQSPDARMQRPEYLGGTSVPLNVTTVAQTSATDTTSPQGNLSAFVTASSDAAWSKSFTEHCVILGLANIRADLSYQQGLPRMFSRKTRYDFYWPELANLGEQAVLNKEIYAQGTSADDDVFGYQERWAEYRYHPNTITGLMRSTASTSLDVWHLAQNFTSLPTLGYTFITEHVPISRVVAVPSEPPMLLDGWFEVDCARPMPLYSVPGLGKRL